VEGRFTLENTNDMGEPLIPQSAQVIIAEFKKFMFLVICKIMRNKRTGRINADTVPMVGNYHYYKSPYAAPPYLD
jgi:hypothetical protein